MTSVTSVLTSTGIFTSSSYSAVVVGTTTLTGTSESTIISESNTLGVFGPTHYSWDYWNITVNPGTTQITGVIGPGNIRVAFYILTPQQFGDFQNANSDCSGYQGGEIEVDSLTSAYSLDWPNPPAGLYYVLFFDNIGGPTYSVTTPFYLAATSTQEQISTVYSASVTSITVSTTETSTFIQASQITQGPLSSIPGFPWPSIFLGFLIGLAILLLTRSRKFRLIRPNANTYPSMRHGVTNGCWRVTA